MDAMEVLAWVAAFFLSGYACYRLAVRYADQQRIED